MQAACLRLRLPEWRKDRRAEGATEREGSQEGRKPRRSSRLLELGERDRGARGRGCWPSVRGGGAVGAGLSCEDSLADTAPAPCSTGGQPAGRRSCR